MGYQNPSGHDDFHIAREEVCGFEEIGDKLRLLVSMCDASNLADLKDSRCQHCDVLQWCGGTVPMLSSKHAHAGWGSPANEYMAIRWAAVSVMKFRHLFEELGLHEVIKEPTKIYVDNNTAIHWVKTEVLESSVTCLPSLQQLDAPCMLQPLHRCTLPEST